MKENLKVTKNPAGETIVRYCYDNDSNICNTDGGLYDWNTAMDGSTEEGSQGICPSGWHVPKDAEWHILESDLAKGSCYDRDGLDCDPAGTRLKTGGSSGFESILTGFGDHKGSFIGRGQNANFWSSTKFLGITAWDRRVTSLSSGVYRYPIMNVLRFSVRCIKD